jgi:hypothetical protein
MQTAIFTGVKSPNFERQSASFTGDDWPLIVTMLPKELDKSAKELGAILRKRNVQNAEELLKLGFAYSLGGFSLRETADWAQMAQVVNISDVALLNRLRKAKDWFGWIVAQKLLQRTIEIASNDPLSNDLGFTNTDFNTIKRRIRLFDATVVSKPGSKGTDWRLHVGFNLQYLCIDHVEITDATGGETFTRHTFTQGDLVLGDRGYAQRAGICAVKAQQADIVVRLPWQNVPLEHYNSQEQADGTVFDLFEALHSLPVGQILDVEVQTAADPKNKLPAVQGRLVAVRKSDEAAKVSRDKVQKAARKKGKVPDPRTLEAAGFVFLFTTLSSQEASGEAILELYRFRWQIELAFKRLKGILFLDEMTAKDPDLCRVFLLMKLLSALLIEDLQSRWASFSPWGYGSSWGSGNQASFVCSSSFSCVSGDLASSDRVIS